MKCFFSVLIFAEVAEQSPHEIIAYLIKAGETWANGRPQDDDVTFVVMKVI
jgi:serine phosphatase RsbU (regulator of sigma subunit)